MYFFLCSHLFQLSDSVNQMRPHQTLHTATSAIAAFPWCRGGREGSWEGGWMGRKKEVVNKGIRGWLGCFLFVFLIQRNHSEEEVAFCLETSV